MYLLLYLLFGDFRTRTFIGLSRDNKSMRMRVTWLTFLRLMACDDVAKPLGYTLKEEQRKVLCSFVGGEEVCAVLPTGYSKSLCYQCLPFIFDSLRTDGLQSVILVISPLVAIIKDQVRKHPSGGNHGSHICMLFY